MKKIFFALFVMGMALCLFGFTSCEDDYDTDERVEYGQHDDDWGKGITSNGGNETETCSYYAN